MPTEVTPKYEEVFKSEQELGKKIQEMWRDYGIESVVSSLLIATELIATDNDVHKNTQEFRDTKRAILELYTSIMTS